MKKRTFMYICLFFVFFYFFLFFFDFYVMYRIQRLLLYGCAMKRLTTLSCQRWGDQIGPSPAPA